MSSTIEQPRPASGLGTLRRRVDAVTGGAIALPLVITTLLYAFDEFDTAAFGVLAPTIEKAFHLSDSRFGFIVILNLSFVLLLAIPVGYLGDRVPRTKLVVLGGIVAGVFSFLTGAVGTVALLVAVRIGNGIGNLVNQPVHNSLLADYYQPENRPRVFAWHQDGVYIGAVVGPAVAGVVSAFFGWRAAFMVLIVPIVAMSLLALKLREPVRGATDDPDSAQALEREEPVPFREATRVLWAVRTLKRQYISFAFVGAGVLPLAFILPLYFKRVFGVGELGRGLIVAAAGASQFAGVLMAGRYTQRWLAKGLGEPIKRCGFALIVLGVGILLTALTPNLVLAIVMSWATYFVGGWFYPPFLTTQALVSPARVRTLSFGFGSLFLVGGVWALWLIPGVATVSDNHGIRWGLGVLSPYWIVAGLLLASSAAFVERDTAQALSNMATTLALRRERLSAGERSLLVCRGVDVSYGQTQVLFGVDFDVREGEIVALLGTNGAGKSTLLKAIAGTINPAAGAIFYDGRDVTRFTAMQATASGVVIVPGGKGVFPGLSVAENLALAGWLLRRDEGYVREATAHALSFFPVLRERWDQKAGNLSGGEQQMLTIAMCLLARPKLMMIDELSLGLAPVVVEQLLEVVRRIHADGVTVVLVEQSVNLALTLAHRAVFMEKGEVRFDGPTNELLHRSDILRSVFLEGAAAAVDADQEGLAGGRHGNGAARTAERKPFEIPTDRKGRVRPPVLAVKELSVSFGGIRAVDGVDLSVHEGQILGLIGPNGAGKTTIFDLVSGFLSPDGGRIVLGGTDVTSLPPDARARRGLGRSFQDARLFPSMTVTETISVALERHLRVKDPLAAALASPATKAAEKEVAERVGKLIDLMRLSAFANKFIFELSTGSRRIVDLACTLAHEPTVLLLDEPSSGIAQRETEALGPLLLDIRDETGAGLVVIEHDMPLITAVSDEMVALVLGQVVVRGTSDEVVNDPVVVASYLGTTEEVIQRSGESTSARSELHQAFAHETAATGGGRHRRT